MTDPFVTAALRAAVLDSWAASPTRFREDANAEEDLVLGGYADAWFVELAQNAADAAREGGRLRLTAVGNELRVANTGAPLDAAGVAALASLRASAKRDDHGSVGRFGVGFAAVLTVTAAPRVISTGGGVEFSAARTAAELAHLPAATAELARRDEPPVLRLVWPVAEEPPAGYATEIRMPLRPGVDAGALLAEARAAAPDLLLALTGLVEIVIGDEVLCRSGDSEVRIGGAGWRLVRRSGQLGDAARDAAAEQRGRSEWTVTWALPLGSDGEPAPLPADVLHAPTATAEPLSLPARLIATLPLEPDRRRVRPGPATDAVLAGAAAAYLELVGSVAPAHRIALVPEPGFPRSELDGRVRDLLLDTLRGAAWLPGADGAELTPGAAEWLDLPGGDALPALLGFPGLLAAPAGPPTVLAALGVHRLTPAAAVERLFGSDHPPGWWRALYAALEPLVESVPGLREELRALPVPLVDGRTASGPPTVLLPADELTLPTMPGLHIAHPDAVHPLLARLGAEPADVAALLTHPALAEAVARSVEDAEAGLDPRPLAEAVLALVAARGDAPPELAALALPDEDGYPARADELVLADGALRPVLAPDGPLGILDAAFGAHRDALVAVGVLDGFAVLVDEHPAAPDHDLDDEERWWDARAEPPDRMLAVRDLDLVDDAAWPQALALLAAGRETRAAVLEPGGYTAWWLARHARIGGRRPAHWRLASAEHLAELYDPADVAVDEALLAAIGVRADLAVAGDAADVLDRLADPARHPGPALVLAAHEALVAADVWADLDPPERVRALDGSVVDVDVAMVLDEPWLLAVLPAGEVVAGGDPAALAELLDLPLASEIVAADVEGAGEPVRWADLPEVVVACHSLDVPVPAGTLYRHDELWVRVRRPEQRRVRVPAWRGPTGEWHAADPVRAVVEHLGRARAGRILKRATQTG